MMKHMKPMAATVLLAALTVALSSCGTTGQLSGGTEGEPMEITQEWDKTFPKSNKVDHRKVTFTNRYGIVLVADLYTPKEAASPLPAIATSGSYGAVKEQVSGRYAQEMAERGFVTLAFDPSYMGESGGQPRLTVSPDALVEDFSAAVDWLGVQDFVDRQRIGVIGICGGGGFSVCAASIDPRIKALATVSMYDMGRATREGISSHPSSAESASVEQRKELYAEVAAQRWREAEGEEARIRFGTPTVLPENPSAVTVEFFDFYRNSDRGEHPRYMDTRFTSQAALTNFYPFEQIDLISPRPVLFIVGEVAHSRYFSEDAYQMAQEPKELYVVPGANHVDLYDQMDVIPFDKLEAFFKDNL